MSASAPPFNLVVRALHFREGRLLVSRWESSYCFPVGGRLEPGETLEAALTREFAEETARAAQIKKFVYFHEHLFTDGRGARVHELGWYFWVEADGPIANLEGGVPHPDSARLSLEYVAVDRLTQARLFPEFLVSYLPGDLTEDFAHTPRHLITAPGADGRLQTMERNLVVGP